MSANEEKYQDSKKKELERIIGEHATKAEWIWIGTHSRRKVNFQIDGKNRIGFFAEKSHDLIEIEKYDEAEKEISDLIPHLKNLLKSFEQNLLTQIGITLFDNGLDLVFTAKRELNFSQSQKLLTFAKEKNLNISCRVKNDLTPIFLEHKNQIFYPDFKIILDSDVFIQATKSGLQSIIKIIRENISQEKAVDLYCGFGAYSFAIHDLAKSVLAFEGDQKMVDLLNKNASANNLAQKIKSEKRDLFSDPVRKKELNKFDVAIINPPRNGASPQVLEIAKSDLKKTIYVSCNPQSFMRDAQILIDSGFKITKLFALDQFYATKHLELISIFQR